MDRQLKNYSISSLLYEATKSKWAVWGESVSLKQRIRCSTREVVGIKFGEVYFVLRIKNYR